MAERFAAWLRQARDDLGVSQSELARRSGVSQGNISRMEAGTLNPTAPTLEKLAAALGRDKGEVLVPLIQEEFVLIPRALAPPELAGEIRVLLKSRMVPTGVRRLLKAILEQIEEHEMHER